MTVSGSGECRGGFFTNALLAEHADEFNVRPPTRVQLIPVVATASNEVMISGQRS